MIIGETVTWRRWTDSGERDGYGNPVFTWVDTPVHRASVDPVSTTEEDEQHRTTADIDVIIRFRERLSVTESDRFIVRGEEYEVEEVEVWVNPFLDEFRGMQVNLTRLAVVPGG